MKHAVHIPCWNSFRVAPWRWCGVCFGRTARECYWTGLRQTRWARGAYAGAISPEFVFPVQAVGRRGYLSDVQALCWLYCLAGCLASCGVGQAFSLCGNVGCNFAACASCHARERLRRRYGLPPAFGLPPGIDDCAVHFLCFYCASHQELREMALRGVDGPGLHILDVLPGSFAAAPGGEAAAAARRAEVDRMLAHPPRLFVARKKNLPPAELGTEAAAAAISEKGEELGWEVRCCETAAPQQQAMERGEGLAARRAAAARAAAAAAPPRTHSVEELGQGGAEAGVPPRAWSVAY